MRKVKVLMVVAGVLAAMVSTPATGYASTDDGMAKSTAVVEAAEPVSCPEGFICLYAHANYLGFMNARLAGQAISDFTKTTCGREYGCYTNNDFNDETSSWINNTNTKYCVSWGINGGNPDNTMPPRTRGNFTADWNDQASSLGFINCP